MIDGSSVNVPEIPGCYINSLNALANYFHKIRDTKKYNFYCVFKGNIPGIYKSYPEAMVGGVGNEKQPWYKGTITFQEATSLMQTHYFGPNYYISPECQDKSTLDTTIADCENCNTLIRHH